MLIAVRLLAFIAALLTQTTAPNVEPRYAQPNSEDFVHVPTSEEWALAYPERSLRLGVSGGAYVACAVKDNGALSACRTLKEEPKDSQFGEAIKYVARDLKLRPKAAAEFREQHLEVLLRQEFKSREACAALRGSHPC